LKGYHFDRHAVLCEQVLYWSFRDVDHDQGFITLAVKCLNKLQRRDMASADSVAKERETNRHRP
jgi:hypothetical protein